MPGLSAVVITREEQKNIERCLGALSFCDEIVVVDSESRDQTVAIAEKFGAKVFLNPFKDFASQKKFAVSRATGAWILSIDADEVVTPSLREEILHRLKASGGFAAYALPRRNFIFGKRLRFGGSGRDAPVRLFRKGQACFEGVVHESLRVDGAVGRLRKPLLHYSTPDTGGYFQKLTLYATLEAKTLDQRSAVFRSAAIFWRPLGRFLQRYFIQGGFLDGYAGFLFAVLSSYYEFVRYAIFWEIFSGFFDRIDRSPLLLTETKS